jgi:membrane protein DedA with SNARE-associated domain
VALLAAGAAVAAGSMRPMLAVGLPMAALLFGDSLLYLAGRYTGWGLLGLLCRVSLNPETCILRSAKSFYERGRTMLLIAKFLPGINTMAPPLAGSMNMRPTQFLRLDFGGVLAYTLAYETIGFLFHGVFQQLMRGLKTFGEAAQWIAVIGFLIYLGYRAWIYRRHRKYRLAPRVTVKDGARRLDRDAAMLLADVRSHGYYDAGAQRILRSVRLEPNNLDAMAVTLPKDKPIYLYCT